MRPRGDGSTDVRARIPDHAANRLRAYLNAYTAPRRRHLDQPADDEVARLPFDRQRGEAFVALLENLLSAGLPRHGGIATTVMVTLDYETLVSGVGVATTSTGDRLSAGQARRLACQAGILPVVLGGDSEILDVGRTRRLVTDAIRKALNLRDRGCTARGMHHACGVLRGPPHPALGPRRQDQPRERQAALFVPPSPRSRPRLAHAPRGQRKDQLHHDAT